MLLLMFVFIFFIVFYLYNTRTFGYWAKKGVKHDKPVLFFGNNTKNFLMRQSRAEAMAEMYWKYPEEKVVGYFRSSTPELVVRDPDIVKQVMISDFGSFHMRGFHPNKDAIEPVMRNLFVLEGDTWKMLRTRMTPAFSSGKLKAMFPLIVDRAEKLRTRTLNAKSVEPIDSRDLMARYTTDFIGMCGFGLNAESLDEEDNEIRKLGYDIFNFGFKELVIGVLKEVFPKLCKDLKLYGRVESRLFGLVNHIRESRGNKPSGRNDFLDQLLEYQQKGSIEIESIEKFLPDGTPERVTIELDDNLLAAQVFLFFAAGFETSSNTTSYTLHMLAYNPEIQKKVLKEVDTVLTKYNDKLCYDAIQEMTYLECCFKEAMRMFPALGYLMRQCTRKYTFSDIDLTIDEGVKILIPVNALHMDPKYWDNPKKFYPDRFLSENFTSRQKGVYFAFGQGPRNCIGTRLGQMQSMAGLAAILSRFTVEPAPDSIEFPEYDPKSDVVQSPKAGKLPLIFRERKL